MERREGLYRIGKAKVCALLLFIAVTLVFSGCLSEGQQEASAKTFTKSGMSIELTEAFTEKELVNYTAYYESTESVVMALKEEFSLAEGIADITLQQYAQLVLDNNDKDSQIVEKDGLTYFVFENTANGKDYTYFASVYKGSDAFWLIQFSCEVSNYESFEDDFIKWAKSVKV